MNFSFNNLKLLSQLDGRTFQEPKMHYNKQFNHVILSVYINKQKDPQRDIFVDTNSYEYIKPLYSTMKEKNLHGIIFYDNLSQDFIEKYQTDKIIFLKCSMKKNNSINDERFIVYYNFLLKYPYEKILCSDVSDVYINKNPFDIISIDKLYVGENHNWKKPPLMWYDYYNEHINNFNNQIIKINNEHIFERKDIGIYSAGLICGYYDLFIKFLSKYAEILNKLDSNDYNMLVLNYIIREYLLEDYDEKTYCTKHVFTGYPFNSVFKKYEKAGESKAYLIHK
tara:strand:+ start:576 stop:1418 length:843 start_codon:yes stop_codon:yes gene_type:complete